MKPSLMLATPLVLALLSACGAPDPKALHTFACQQAANTIDLQSVAQLDALRKALGLAPDVDPLGACKALGVEMNPKPSPAERERAPEAQAEQES